MTDDEIKAAVAARLDAEEAAGQPRTITNPKILADLGPHIMTPSADGEPPTT